MMNVCARQSALAIAISTALALPVTSLGTQAHAAQIDFNWQGVFSLLDPGGAAVANPSTPAYNDPAFGYGQRTPISGTLSVDPDTGTGTVDLTPFQFFGTEPQFQLVANDFVLNALGDGNGGPGTLVQANMEITWNSNVFDASLIWDASGLFAASPFSVGDTIANTGALPASNDIGGGSIPIGPAPLASTTYDSAFPLAGDGIAGTPTPDGPTVSFNYVFDVTSLTVTSVVPIPAALWLFGAGALGLFGVARRRPVACKGQ